MNYPVIEHFHSFQGEGEHMGKSAFFIRLAGCPVRCAWCDSAETWRGNAIGEAEKISAEKLAEFAGTANPEIVVITGGEPTIHDLQPLVDALHAKNLPVHLETCGAFRVPATIDWITLSPKITFPPLAENWPCANEIKFIITSPDDLLFWEKQLQQNLCSRGSGDILVAGTLHGNDALCEKTRGSGDILVAGTPRENATCGSGDILVAASKIPQLQNLNSNPSSIKLASKKIDAATRMSPLPQAFPQGFAGDKNVAAPTCSQNPVPAKISPSLFLSAAEKIDVFRGKNLQHWDANKKLQFVTFRLADSLPLEIAQKIQEQKRLFLQENPQPWDDFTQEAFFAQFGAKTEEYLAAGHGSCVLARKDCQVQVIETLFVGNGEKYDLHAFVIMPNHIHALFELIGDATIGEIVKLWKGVSANKINKILGSAGTLWQGDYFDRIVRGESHYEKILKYIENNKAPNAFHWFRGNENSYGNELLRARGSGDILVAASKIPQTQNLNSNPNSTKLVSKKIDAATRMSPLPQDSSQEPNSRAGDKNVAVPTCSQNPVPAKLPTLWLHPEWSRSRDEKLLAAIVDFVRSRGKPWRAGWQLHKLYHVK